MMSEATASSAHCKIPGLTLLHEANATTGKENKIQETPAFVGQALLEALDDETIWQNKSESKRTRKPKHQAGSWRALQSESATTDQADEQGHILNSNQVIGYSRSNGDSTLSGPLEGKKKTGKQFAKRHQHDEAGPGKVKGHQQEKTRLGKDQHSQDSIVSNIDGGQDIGLVSMPDSTRSAPQQLTTQPHKMAQQATTQAPKTNVVPGHFMQRRSMVAKPSHTSDQSDSTNSSYDTRTGPPSLNQSPAQMLHHTISQQYQYPQNSYSVPYSQPTLLQPNVPAWHQPWRHINHTNQTPNLAFMHTQTIVSNTTAQKLPRGTARNASAANGSMSTHRNTAQPVAHNTIDLTVRTKKEKFKTNVLPVPVPTPAYFSQASQPRRSCAHGKQELLLILDLNGTLVHRNKSSKTIKPRKQVKEFLECMMSNHLVMIWSSARPENVEKMLKSLLTPDARALLVAEWARDRLGLTQTQMANKVQVYKQLSWVWNDAQIGARYPGRQFSQRNTVLVDDSVLKAAAEPFNLVQVPEFGGADEADDVLSQVMGYVDWLSKHEDVSTAITDRPFKLNDGWQWNW